MLAWCSRMNAKPGYAWLKGRTGCLAGCDSAGMRPKRTSADSSKPGIIRACPESQHLASFSRRVMSELAWQKHCTLPELLLLSDVAATVSHLVRSGRPLYDSLEELAQVFPPACQMAHA